MQERTFYLHTRRPRHHRLPSLHPIIDMMRNAHPNLSRLLILVYALLSSAIVCLAAKHFVMPAAQPAKSYPAHDEHPSEAVTIAVDPYDMADKANIFSVLYFEFCLLPVFLLFATPG